MKGSNQQLTPMILAPARAIRTAHSPALVPCNTALRGHWSVVTGPGLHLLVAPGSDTHGGRHGLVVAQGQLQSPLHLLDVVEMLTEVEQLQVVIPLPSASPPRG